MILVLDGDDLVLINGAIEKDAIFLVALQKVE